MIKYSLLFAISLIMISCNTSPDTDEFIEPIKYNYSLIYDYDDFYMSCGTPDEFPGWMTREYEVDDYKIEVKRVSINQVGLSQESDRYPSSMYWPVRADVEGICSVEILSGGYLKHEFKETSYFQLYKNEFDEWVAN